MIEGERPANLMLWLKNGSAYTSKPERSDRKAVDTVVSIGRTNSKKALGFIVSHQDTKLDFVLDKEQVEELAEFLRIALPRLKSSRGTNAQFRFLTKARGPVRREHKP